MKMTLMKKVCFGMILAVVPLQADIIYLKNGKTARGKIVGQTRTSIRIKWPNGRTQTYQKKNIKRIKFETIDLKAEKAKKEAARKKRLDAIRRKKEELKKKQLAKEKEAKEKRNKEAEEKQNQNQKLAEYRKNTQIKLQKLEKEKSDLLKKQKELEMQNRILKEKNNENQKDSEKIEQQKKSDLLAARQKWQKEQKENEKKMVAKLKQDFEKEQKQKEAEHKRQLDKERENLKSRYANQSKSQYKKMSDSQGSALWRSAILPGWGQVYKDETTKGYSFMGAWLVLLGASATSSSSLQAAQADFDDLTLTFLGLASGNTSLVLLDQIQSAQKQVTYTKAARQFNLSVLLLAGFYIYNIYDASSIQESQAQMRQQTWRPRFDVAIVPESASGRDRGKDGLFQYDNMRMQAEVRMRW